MNERQLSELLNGKKVEYKILRHKPVFNIQEASAELGVKPEEEVKNILLKDGKGFFLLIAVGNTKIDFKAVQIARGTKKTRFAFPDEVKQQTGVENGSVNLFSYPAVYVDSKVILLKEINVHPDDNSVTFILETSQALGLLENKTIGKYCV